MRNWQPACNHPSKRVWNSSDAILSPFALLEDAPGVPGLDLPGLDIVSLAKGFGCHKAHADTADE